MTSENELDVIKTTDTNEMKEELSVINNNPIEEQINIEKPKRGGRKKRESVNNLNNDLSSDSQPLFEQPVILEGKRSRKPTSRLELSDLSTPKKELSIPQGIGKPLGEIEYINYQLANASNDALTRIRNICFGRRAGSGDVRKNLREFKGFEFTRESEEYERHLSSLTKLKKDQLESISDILGLSSTGSNDEQAKRIFDFLMEPIDEGKSIPERKLPVRTSKQASIIPKEPIHTDDEEFENGDDDDDNDEDAIFDEEDDIETDDDYNGSDYEGGLSTKDDPDDFVYRPGKKTPKKRTPVKRSRSRSTPKRKRRAPTRTPSTRGRKKSKIIVDTKTENEDVPPPPASTEPIQTNTEETEKPSENNSTTEETIKPSDDNLTTEQPKTDDLDNTETKSIEQTDIIPSIS